MITAAFCVAVWIIDKGTAVPELFKKGIITRFLCRHKYKFNRRQPIYFRGKKMLSVEMYRCSKCGEEGVREDN